MKAAALLAFGAGFLRDVSAVVSCGTGQICAGIGDCGTIADPSCSEALDLPPNSCPFAAWISTGVENCGNLAAFTECCRGVGSGGNDPWITGLRGQKFLFDGEDGKWYSLIHDPHRLNLNMRIYSPLENDPTTFFNGAGITVYDGAEEHRIVLTTKDTKNFHPECAKGEVCIANGALELEVDGVKVSSPGFHALGEEIDLTIVNAPWDCKRVPEAHKEWDKVQLAMDKKMEKRGRRLTVFEPELDVLQQFKRNVFDTEKCAAWAAERKEKKDIFQVNGEHATMFLTVKDFSIQLEFTLNTDPRWIDHQRFDVTVAGLISKDPEAVSGVLGETATLKYDSILKTPILDDRDEILSGPDSDYEVTGPFGTEFKARKHTQLRKLF